MALESSIAALNATRRSLLTRLKNWEDQASWQEFYNRYWRLVYSVAVKAGLSDTEAQEVVQETFIAVAKKMPEFKYDPALGSFKSWLLHTTQWRISDQLRKRKKDGPLRHSPSSTPGTTTVQRIPDAAAVDLNDLYEQEWEKNLFRTAVEKVKARVDPRHYQIFDLYALKNWPVTKVAKAFAVTSSRVYLVKHRVSQLVKKEMEALKKAG